MIIRVLGKCFLKLLGIQLSTCWCVGKGNNNRNSLDKKQIQVVKSRQYILSLILNRMQTSAASKPSLRWMSTENSWFAMDIPEKHRGPHYLPLIFNSCLTAVPCNHLFCLWFQIINNSQKRIICWHASVKTCQFAIVFQYCHIQGCTSLQSCLQLAHFLLQLFNSFPLLTSFCLALLGEKHTYPINNVLYNS